jgi:hypothetical protein
MAKPTTEEKAAGKGPRVDLDQLETALGTPPDTAQPVHTEEDEPATNDNVTIEQVNNRGEERPDAAPKERPDAAPKERPDAAPKERPDAAPNPIEELVDSQTSHVLAELTRLSVEVQMLIDDIKESRTAAVTQATEHARRTSLGAKAAIVITEHLARVRLEFAPPA